MASVVSMKSLLEAGVHFGHQTRRWNPKMAPYIYTERNGIYIVDLQKTVKKLEEAYAFVRQLSENGHALPHSFYEGMRWKVSRLFPNRYIPESPPQFFPALLWWCL